MYIIYTDSVGVLPSALPDLAIKDLSVASTADDLTADLTPASVLWRSSSSSCCRSREMSAGARDHHLFPD